MTSIGFDISTLIVPTLSASLALLGQFAIKVIDQKLDRERHQKESRNSEYRKFIDRAPNNDFFRDMAKINLSSAESATDSECGFCEAMEKDIFEIHIENRSSLDQVISVLYGIYVVGSPDVKKYCEELIGAINNMASPIDRYADNICFDYVSLPDDFVRLSDDQQRQIYSIREISRKLFLQVSIEIYGDN